MCYVKLLILSIFFLIPEFSQAQYAKIDSLENQLRNGNLTDTSRVQLLNELCWEHRDKDFPKALQYGEEALKLAQNIGYYYGAAKSLNFTGVVYRNMGDYALAMQEFFEALNTAEEYGVKEQLGYAYNNVGDIYKELKQYPESLAFSIRAIELFQETENLRGMAYGYIRMGEVYQERNQLDSALIIFKKSLDIRKQLGSLNQISSSLDRVGEIYQAKGAFAEALDYYNQSLEIAQEINNQLRIADTKWSIGNVHLDQGELEKAERFIRDALTISENVGAKDFIVNAAYTLSEVYSKKKDYEKAYYLQSKYADMKDELVNEEIRNQVKGIEIQQELQKAQSELELRQKNEQINKILIYSLVGVVTLILIIIIILLKNRKNNLEINRKLQHQNKKLESLNNFRLRILAIISHDTRGPLHSISSVLTLIQKQAVSLEEAKTLFKQLEDRVGQVNLLLDNILAWSKRNFDKTEEEVNSSKQDLTLIVGKTIRLFSYNIEYKQIKIDNTIENSFLYADKNMLNTIIRNLMANAIKFTEKEGEIKIYTEKTPRGIKTYVQDNGIGMSPQQLSKLFTEQVISTEGSNQEIGTGLGLMLCKQYVELNGGTMGVKSQENEGSTFWFELPEYQEA